MNKPITPLAPASPTPVMWFEAIEGEYDEWDGALEEPRYYCPRCNDDTAYYVPKDNHWYPDRFECGCGWWQRASEYEHGNADLWLGGDAA